MKRNLFIIVIIIILANIPYIGYLPQIFTNECTGSLPTTGMCGYPSIFALLNPLFWLPAPIINYIGGSGPFKIHLYYEPLGIYNYVPIQCYMHEILSIAISLVLFIPYWIILSILLRKVLMKLDILRRGKS